jgi:hypothetical protein
MINEKQAWELCARILRGSQTEEGSQTEDRGWISAFFTHNKTRYFVYFKGLCTLISGLYSRGIISEQVYNKMDKRLRIHAKSINVHPLHHFWSCDEKGRLERARFCKRQAEQLDTAKIKRVLTKRIKTAKKNVCSPKKKRG